MEARCTQTRCRVQGRPCPLTRIRRARLFCVRPLATTADYSIRVRGDCGRVQHFVSDLERWPVWHPGTTKAVKLGVRDAPIAPGARFEVFQSKWGLKMGMTYEILEYEPSKRLVLSGLSEYHTQLDQFTFMPDRHDAKHTCVRYISNLRLREWRSALQPVIGKMMAQVPEEALQRLQRTLASPQSPLATRSFEAQYSAAVRAFRSKGRSAAGTAANSGSSTPTRGSSSGGWGGPVKAWNLRNLFSWGSDMESSTDSASSSPWGTVSSSSSASGKVLDPNGYYTVLGLEACSQVSQDDIKAAYRRLAMEWHPDRQTSKDERAKAAAAINFAKLLKAYEVLGDEEQRRIYDQGGLVEATLSL